MNSVQPISKSEPQIREALAKDGTSGKLSRRMMLAGVAAVPAAVVASASAVARIGQSAAGPIVSEDPALLDLGAKLEPAVDAFRAAVERKKTARATAEAACPTVPEVLVAGADDELGRLYAVDEIDIEDKVITPKPANPMANVVTESPRRIFRSDLLRDAIQDAVLDGKPRSKVVRRAKALVPIAETFEAGREAAIEQSGLHAAELDRHYRTYELDELCRDILKMRAKSLRGAAIMARAIIAQKETWPHTIWHTSLCATNLAEAVLRLAPTGPHAA